MRIVRPVTVTDSIMLSSNVPETDYAAYSAATTYALGNRVILVSTHKIYESLQAGNLNHNPPDNLTGATPWWLEVGATNRWKMFDGVVGQQTDQSSNITVGIDTSNLNNISLINLDATTVYVETTDNVSSEVTSSSYDLINQSNVVDLYTYFFEPFYYTKNVAIDLPVYSDSTTLVYINNSVANAKCGELIPGNYLSIGCTQFGSSIGITDYSVKQVDDFGNYSILQRAFSKRGRYDVMVQNSMVEAVLNLLSDYRSTPVVWLPTTNETLASPLIVYGFYKDFSIVIQYSTESSCSLEIEGLI